MQPYPYVAAIGDLESTAWVDMPSELRLEVYDYWYRQPGPGATFEVGQAGAL